ncbi:MAG: peptidase M50 [Ruminiclostridium sp.]|nr:peptidase M50 [Ruminiclostridium sp.]
MLSIGKTEIKFDFTFFAVVGLLVFIDTSGTSTLSLIASLTHETGHLIAMLLCKSKLSCITFYGGGINIASDIATLPFWRRLFIMSSGCLVNFLIFIIGTQFFSDNQKIMIFAVVNLVICIFNLIPVGYFDGAGIIDIFFSRFCDFKIVEILKRIISVAFSVAIIVSTLIYCFVYNGKVSISFLFVVFYLILAQFVA